jgi:hypothetical protein
MTATIYDPWPKPQTQCHCPNCGNTHATSSTTITMPAWGMAVPGDAEFQPARDLRKSLEHYEAIGESRDLARGQLPTALVRERVAVARDPRRVHLLRCMTRRPRLSLLERVRGRR